MVDQVLAPEELLRRATELVPVLRERAAQTEELRRIPDESVRDLLASELHLIGVPRRFGGLDVDYGLMLEVAALLPLRGATASGRPTPGWWAIGPLRPKKRSSETAPMY